MTGLFAKCQAPNVALIGDLAMTLLRRCEDGKLRHAYLNLEAMSGVEPLETGTP
jgi:hypothetical protein